MKFSRVITILIAGVGAAAQCASAQPQATATDVTISTAAATPIAKAHTATGGPYSFARETHKTQTLADGTTVDTVPDELRQYRDSQGRIRVEVYLPQYGDAEGTRTLVNVTITDPVAGTEYSLNPEGKEAILITPHKSTASSNATTAADADSNATAPSTSAPNDSAPPEASPAAPPDAAPAKPERKIESLGTDTMLGLTVKGVLVTATWPVGSVNNDQPVVVTGEQWRSTDLGIDMLSKISDPRTGVTTIRVTQIDRNEPDASLFRVPADYEIVSRDNSATAVN